MKAVIDAHALPARTYTDPESYAGIRAKVLDRAWHYVCHVSNVPGHGDYLAFTLLGEDLFVVRGRDGVLRAFYNVCQHRGHPLVREAGHATALVCPYHAWTYDLDGRLRGAPGTRAMPGFDRTRICLTEVRLDTFLGFVFVNLDDRARPMTETYPGVEMAVRAVCPDVEDRAFAHEHAAREGCNWLVAVENYNECYHCGRVHKAFSAGVIDPKSYDIQPFGTGRVLRHTAAAASGAGKWYDGGGTAYASFFLYPCFSLQIYPGGLVNTYSWRPLAHDDTEVHRGWFSRNGAVDDGLRRVIALDRDTTFAEDLDLVKAVQRGLASRGYRPGPLVIASEGRGINSEHAIKALHDWIREDLG